MASSMTDWPACTTAPATSASPGHELELLPASSSPPSPPCSSYNDREDLVMTTRDRSRLLEDATTIAIPPAAPRHGAFINLNHAAANSNDNNHHNSNNCRNSGINYRNSSNNYCDIRHDYCDNRHDYCDIRSNYSNSAFTDLNAGANISNNHCSAPCRNSSSTSSASAYHCAADRCLRVTCNPATTYTPASAAMAICDGFPRQEPHGTAHLLNHVKQEEEERRAGLEIRDQTCNTQRHGHQLQLQLREDDDNMNTITATSSSRSCITNAATSTTTTSIALSLADSGILTLTASAPPNPKLATNNAKNPRDSSYSQEAAEAEDEQDQYCRPNSYYYAIHSPPSSSSSSSSSSNSNSDSSLLTMADHIAVKEPILIDFLGLGSMIM